MNSYHNLGTTQSIFEVNKDKFEAFKKWTNRYDFDRSSTLNWLIKIALRSKFSDEALFLAVKCAENILTTLHF